MHDDDLGVIGDVELRRRLKAYAETRLSPSAAMSSRMRTRVMAAAQRRADTLRAEASLAEPAVVESDTVVRPFLMRGSRWRRPFIALLAASLTVAVAVGSVAAAHAGGPLYGARLWAETLTLPASADQRAKAEVGRLNERLSEAAQAMASGDANAANAALAAYNGILAESTAGANGDVVADATLGTAVRRNIQVLTVLLDRVPEQARDAIQHAIDVSDSAANGLPGQPLSTPGNGPGATDRPTHTANPNKPTPKSHQDPTIKSHPTPKPRPTP